MMRDNRTKQNSKVVKIKVEGMNCGRCVSRVEQSVNDLAGVKNTSVNIMTDEAVVVFDASQTKVFAIINSIERLGYSATEFTESMQKVI
jgi:copper chaperone CopZ